MENVLNKPDWKIAPSWARWLAADFNGEWYWFEVKPQLDKKNQGWRSGALGFEGHYASLYACEAVVLLPGYARTLEARPISDRARLQKK